jgi:hypothetical protein
MLNCNSVNHNGMSKTKSEVKDTSLHGITGMIHNVLKARHYKYDEQCK